MTTLVFRGPREARAIYHDGSEIARGRHDILGQVSLKCMEAEALLFLGAWDETLRTCDELEDWLAGHEVSGELMAVQELRATVMALRGDERMEEAVRIVRDDDAVTLGTDKVAVTVAAVVLHAAGADQEARQHLEQLAGGTRSLGNQPIFALWLPLALRTARRAGSADLARRLFRAVPPAVTAIPHSSAAIDGLMHEADGDHEAALASFERAAAAWHCIEVSFEEAEARLGIGRCLAALGRSVGAVAALAEAREILARLGAQPALAETEALLIGIARAAAGRTARSGNETTL
jgi:tetratricopeptide (TPR) repeat protein